LLTFGFVIFGAMSFYFGEITLDISPTTLLIPILVTGFGLSFVFVPITTAAYGTLPNEQMGNASGLFNLMRNVGGSIGISIAQTMLTRRSAAHQNFITNSVPITGQQFQNQLRQLQGYFSRGGGSGPFGPGNSLDPAQATLYRELIRQATTWAFVEVFRWLALLSFACVFAVWMLKKVKPGKGPVGAH
jgi:DHA2 family multidrug resistance protein